MSEIAGIPASSRGPRPSSPPDGATRPTAHEEYSFACMRCGHGWEQAYDIEHHVDASGQTHVVYIADGARVPSPLTRPTCTNCDGHLVRIMRAGRVSAAAVAPPSGARAMVAHEAGAGSATGQDPGAARVPAAAGSGRHWHLSDLLHPFQHHRD